MNFYVHDLESTDKASAELLESMLVKDVKLLYKKSLWLFLS